MIRQRNTSLRRSIRPSLRRRLWLQALEDRAVPALFTVNLTGDAGLADPMDVSKGDLRYCIDQANLTAGDDTIVFDAAITSVNLNSQLSIIDPAGLIIDGNGLVTITNVAMAGPTSRLFDITAATSIEIEFRGLTLTGGIVNVGAGGAIQAANTNLRLTDCVFNGNKAATGAGGAVATLSGSTLLNISGCTFSNNTAATAGGALQIIGTTSTVSLDGTIFDSNTATGSNGGAINVQAAATLNIGVTSGCTFTNNKTMSTSSNGGAIHTAGSVNATINNSDFLSNTSAGSVSTGNPGGGAVSCNSAATVTINSSKFQANFSGRFGGAIRLNSSATSVTLNSCTISGNVANASQGGGISMFSGNLKSYYSSFTNNRAAGSGGGVYSTAATITMTNCTISGNESQSGSGGGGGFNLSTGVLNLNNSTVVNNKAIGATAVGGGIRKTSATGSVSLNSTVVAGNTTVSGTGNDIAGTVAITLGGNNNFTGVGTTNNVTFTNPPLTGDPRFAPLDNNGGPTLTHGFRYNSPLIDQGNNMAGKTNDQRGASRSVDDASVVDGSGGFTDIGAVEGKLTTPFADSIAGLTDITSPTMAPYTFSVVYDDESGINVGSLNMGELKVSGPGGFLIFTPTVTGTSAGPGPNQTTVNYSFNPPVGGWQAIHGSIYTIELLANKVLDNDMPMAQANRAQTLGTFSVGIAGAIVVDSSADVDDGNVTPGNISLREAIRISNASVGGTDTISFASTLNGATITLANGQLDVSDSVDIVGPGSSNLTISGLPTAALTNRIFSIIVPSVVAVANISGLTLTNANTTGAGGAVVVSDETVNFTDVAFVNNKATNIGGAVAGTSLTLTFTDCTFTGNSSSASGGAIGMNAGTNVLTITNSTFTNNSSTAQGGAINASSSITLNIAGSMFNGNSAATGGGAINLGTTTSTAIINNSTFIGNTAGSASTSVGGAVNLPSGGTFLFSSSKFMNNSAGQTGGAINGSSTLTTNLTLNDCTLSGNTAAARNGGGAIYTTIAAVMINNSTLSSNVALVGGAITTNSASSVLEINNSTLSGNIANSREAGGGAIRLGTAGATLTIRNSTVAFNSAPVGKGGGLLIGGNTGIVNIVSSIVAKNTALVQNDIFGSASPLSINGSNNVIGSINAANISIDTMNNLAGTESAPLDPGLLPLANYGGPTSTHGLKPGSIANDYGSFDPSFPNDQRGLPRSMATPDAGANEGTENGPFLAGVTLFDITKANAIANSTYKFTVTYDGGVGGVNPASLDAADVFITGPAAVGPITYTGFSTSGSKVIGKYEFGAPGGTWGLANSGVYVVNLAAGQVTDLSMNAIPAQRVGQFNAGTTLTVDFNGDTDNMNYGSGDFTLREAINLINNATGHNTIDFAPALTGQTITLINGQFVLTQSVTIQGLGRDNLTIDGNLGSRIFSVGDNTTLVISQMTINDITLTNGRASTGIGGAILLNGDQLNLNNMAITNSGTLAGAGGAIGATRLQVLENPFVNGSNIRLTGNSSTGGSGGAIDGGGGGTYVTLVDSTLSGNTTSGGGGAISGGYPTINIIRSTLSGNSATNNGGAITFSKTSLTIESSTISGNSGKVGGGIYINSPSSTTTLSIRNSTITNNTATTNGGGIGRGSSTMPIVNISNSIVAGNFNAATPDFFFNTGGIVNGDYNLIGVADVGGASFGGIGNNTIGTLALPTNPMLDVLNDNGGPTFTHLPLTGSPAIDQGNNSFATITDQRGKNRSYDDTGLMNNPAGGDGTDIGAVEINPMIATLPTVSTITINNGDMQRSLVTTIKVTFSETVTFPSGIADAFVVERTALGTPTGSVAFDAVQSGADVVITFKAGGTVGVDPGNSLQDGQYKLTIVSDNVLGIGGGKLDGNGDMIEQGSPTDDELAMFHRLFGDSNGDGAVNATDFNAFRLVYGGGSSIFDFDNDGNTTAADFNAFRVRYGLTGYLP